MAKDKPEKAKKDKTEKAKKKDKPDKAVSKPKAAKKVTNADDFEPVNCKDFLNCRWEITENGQVGIWEATEEGEKSNLTTIPGKISDVVYDKMCGVVGDEEGAKKKTVLQNIILYSSQYNNVFQKINKK